MRVATFFPFQTTYYLNGHSFIEQELNRAEIGFRKNDNAFLAVDGGREFRLADEVRHIQRSAARHDGRIVTLGQLVFFSTETGDAWLLDWQDGLATPLARDGDPEPIHIEETDANFTIDWKGTYRIEGATFIFVDRNTRGTRAILGYPTQKLAHATRGR